MNGGTLLKCRACLYWLMSSHLRMAAMGPAPRVMPQADWGSTIMMFSAADRRTTGANSY